MLPIHHY